MPFVGDTFSGVVSSGRSSKTGRYINAVCWRPLPAFASSKILRDERCAPGAQGHRGVGAQGAGAQGPRGPGVQGPRGPGAQGRGPMVKGPLGPWRRGPGEQGRGGEGGGNPSRLLEKRWRPMKSLGFVSSLFDNYLTTI